MSDSTTVLDLMALLPEVYRVRDRFQHLEDFLQPVGVVSADFRNIVTAWANEFDIGTVNDDYLNHIGNLYGYRSRTAVPNLEGKRRKIRYVMDLWERKGTARGYYLAGIEVDIPTYDLEDNRYSILALSHRGRLSTINEAYIQDNAFHHEGVLQITTSEYIHPQIFFEVFMEFLPAGFMLYVTQTVHQGLADMLISAEGEWHIEDSYWIQLYEPVIGAEVIWNQLLLSAEDVFLSNTVYMDDSIGYIDQNLPFDPQFQVVPPGYTGVKPFSYEPVIDPLTSSAKELRLNELLYPRTDPVISSQTIDTTAVLDSTTVTWVETSSGASSSSPYIIFVSSDGRVLEHLHWMTAGIQGDMVGNVVEYDGNDWSYTNLSGRNYTIDSTADIDATSIDFVETTSGATVANPYIIEVVSDNRSILNDPVELTGDMSGNIIEWNGTIWKWSTK